MWEEFLSLKKIDDCGYEAWQFGDSPDELAELVKSGIKRATASAYELYAFDGEPLPKPGEYSVILNSHDEAMCIIKTTAVYVVRFCGVTEEFAFKEVARLLEEGARALFYRTAQRGRP